MSASRVVISGRVQGVGFRHWMTTQAQLLGISGWVRNRHDGTLEALIDGDPASVQELLRACRRGPPAARVDTIDEQEAEPPDGPGFHTLSAV